MREVQRGCRPLAINRCGVRPGQRPVGARAGEGVPGGVYQLGTALSDGAPDDESLTLANPARRSGDAVNAAVTTQ